MLPMSPRRSDALDVDRLGPRVALFLLVGDAGALGQGAVAVRDDRGMMDEQVAVALVRGDEPEPLVVAEPLDGSGRHLQPSSSRSRAALRGGGGEPTTV